MMWEVLSFGDKPYGEMSNQEVSLIFCSPTSYLLFFQPSPGSLLQIALSLFYLLSPFHLCSILLTTGQASRGL